MGERRKKAMFRSKVSSRFVGIIMVAAASASLGCATSFTGDPHVPGGPAGCIAKCNSWRMELVGMVSMGEYSDGCICRIPQRVGANDAPNENGSVAGAAAAGAAVFVAMEEARRQQQQMQFNMRH
jgi:hypothetical protein